MYIEFVILDNLVLTFLAGTAAARMSGIKPDYMRTAAAATLGTAVAVFYPFMPQAAALPVKAALFLALSAIMFAGKKKVAVAGFMFLACTFMFGGASYALGLALYGDGLHATAFSLRCPLFLVLGAGAVCYLGLRACVARLRLPKARAPYVYRVEIEIFGARMSFDAFLDTGNCVFDGRTGLPVMITDLDCFTEKLDGRAAIEFAKAMPAMRKLSARTVAGSAEIYLLEPQRAVVYSDRQAHTINAMVGLSVRASERGGENKKFIAGHELLLHPAVMAEVGA